MPDRSGDAWRCPVRRTRSGARFGDSTAPRRHAPQAGWRLSRATPHGAVELGLGAADGLTLLLRGGRRAGPLKRRVAVPCTSHQAGCTLWRQHGAAPPRPAGWVAAEPCHATRCRRARVRCSRWPDAAAERWAACRTAQATRGGALYVAPGRVHALETARRRAATPRRLWVAAEPCHATRCRIELGLGAADGLTLLLRGRRRAGPLRRRVAVPCTSHQVGCTLWRQHGAAPPRPAEAGWRLSRATPHGAVG